MSSSIEAQIEEHQRQQQEMHDQMQEAQEQQQHQDHQQQPPTGYSLSVSNAPQTTTYQQNYGGSIQGIGQSSSTTYHQMNHYQTGQYQTGTYQAGTSVVTSSTSPRYHYPTSGTLVAPPTPGRVISSSNAAHQVVSGNTTTTTSYGSSRFVTGEERVIGYNTVQQEERIIRERTVEHEIKVPKKIIREEVIEKVIVVPEKIMREEVIEEVQMVRETIVEVAKPVIQEKIVEVLETEYVDKIVEVVEKVVQEKIREVPVPKYEERIVEVPKIITQERVVEVPEIEYREVIVEKVVEVPQIQEQVVMKEIPVPQYIDKPVPEYVNVDVPVDVDRNIPVPVEAITTFEYQLARFRPRVNKITYPLYVPRFVEVPVSAELFDASTVAQLNAQAARLQILNSTQAVGLCEIENMATEFRRYDVTQMQTNVDLQAALTNAWNNGTAITLDNSRQMFITRNSSSDGESTTNESSANAMFPISHKYVGKPPVFGGTGPTFYNGATVTNPLSNRIGNAVYTTTPVTSAANHLVPRSALSTATVPSTTPYYTGTTNVATTRAVYCSDGPAGVAPHPFPYSGHRLPRDLMAKAPLSPVTYFQAELKDERQSSYSAQPPVCPACKSCETLKGPQASPFQKSVASQYQQSNEGSVSETARKEGADALQLTPPVLEKILKLSPSLQEATLKIIEQQNTIRLIELQSATHRPPIINGGMVGLVNCSSDGADSGRREPPLQERSSRMDAPQNLSNTTSASPKSSVTQSPLMRTSNSMEPPSGPGPAPVEPEKLSPEKLLGLNGAAPTLDEIKEINKRNLELAANSHVARTMPPAATKGAGLQFVDEDKVRETLVNLNPQFAGRTDLLMAALKAKLAGKPIENVFANTELSTPNKATTVSSLEYSTPETAATEVASRDRVDLQSREHYVADEGWDKVCHKQTHSIQIQCESGEVRSVPIIQVYEEPPVFVFSDLLTAVECDALIAVATKHFERIESDSAKDLQTYELVEGAMLPESNVATSMARLPRNRSAFVDRVMTRIATALQVTPEDLEDLTVLKYRPHERSNEHIEPPGRKTTMLIYLNTIDIGGQTDFAKLGFQVQPQAGTAVMWHNIVVPVTDPAEIRPTVDDEHVPELRMLHCSLPCTVNKYVLAVYVKNRG